jgi:hypothetical protein
MSELCKCFICLKESADGVLVSKRTYNRHRKNQQEFLDVEETNINHQVQDLEDMRQQENLHQDSRQQEDLHQGSHQQEDLHQDLHQQWDLHQDLHQQRDMIIDRQENIYQQDEGFTIDDTDDTESFSFSEENNEYYSDYNIEEHDDDNGDIVNENDDMTNENDNIANKDDDMADEDDDMADEDDGDMSSKESEDMMQTDNATPNKEIIEGLKLLYLKSLYNFTESAYDDIIKVFTTNNLSLYNIKKYLTEVTGLVPVFYDMCENSCICYTEEYESYQRCPICDSARLDTKGKAKKVMPYLSIKDRLKTQFSNKNRAKELLYRYEYITNKNDDDLDDIFDGEIYKELVNKNLFNDKRDVVFTASCDGYQIFKQKTDDCWLFLMINNNLEPTLRVKKENLLIPFLIPGPNQPKNFNTFLRPLIDEMKELERMNLLSLFIIQSIIVITHIFLF